MEFDASASSDSDGEIVSYDWEIETAGGLTTYESGATPSHSWDEGGRFEVTLEVTDADGNTDAISRTVAVDNPSPTADFDAIPPSPSPDEDTTLDATGSSDPDGEIVSYDWEIETAGGLTTYESGTTPSHAWEEGGQFEVTLQVTDNGDKSDTVTKVITVDNPAPTADFTTDPLSPSPDEETTLDGTVSNDFDGEIVEYDWDIETAGGLSTYESGATASHSWEEGGRFEVTLEVTDNGGATDSVTKIVEVDNSAPIADFDIAPPIPSPDEEVTLDGSELSDPDGKIVDYEWEIERATGTTAYRSGEAPRFSWNEPGTFDITLAVTDNGGKTKTTTKTVEVTNKAPNADFSISPSKLGAGETVTLDASASSDPDGAIETYEWSITRAFADEVATRTGQSVEVKLTDPGAHTIELTVTDDRGKETTTKREIQVENQPPTAAFDVTPNSPTQYDPVTFDAAPSEDSDTSIETYDWTVSAAGESTVYSGAQVEHTFETAGPHEVELTVTDSFEATDSVTRVVEVAEEQTATSTPTDTATPTSTPTDTATRTPTEKASGQSSTPATTNTPSPTAESQSPTTTDENASVPAPGRDESVPTTAIVTAGVGLGAVGVVLLLVYAAVTSSSTDSTDDTGGGGPGPTTTPDTGPDAPDSGAGAQSGAELSTHDEPGQAPSSSSTPSLAHTRSGNGVSAGEPNADQAVKDTTADTSPDTASTADEADPETTTASGHSSSTQEPSSAQQSETTTAHTDSSAASETEESSNQSEASTTGGTAAQSASGTSSNGQTGPPESLERARTQLEVALDNPFADISETESQLIETHLLYTRAIESLQARDSAPDTHLESARTNIESIESYVEAIEEVDNMFESDQSPLTPANDPDSLQHSAEEELRARQERYETAIAVSEDAGLDTAMLCAARDAIVERLDAIQSLPGQSELVAAIESTHRRLGRIPTVDEVVAHADDSSICADDFTAAFGSYTEALRACSVDAQQAFSEELHRVRSDRGYPPTAEVFAERSDWSGALITEFFGSWEAALEQTFASDELTTNSAGQTVPDPRPAYIDAIRAFAEETDGVLKARAFGEFSEYSSRTVIHEFGSWAEALSAAGVDYEQRLLDEVRRLARDLGRRPTTSDMNKHGTVSASMFNKYCGSYSAAVDRALEDVDLTNAEELPDTAPTSHSGDGAKTERQDRDDSVAASNSAPDNTFVTLDDIASDGRLDRPIAVQISQITLNPDDRTAASLRVTDRNGEQCTVKIWQTHGVEQDWQQNHWYVLKQARYKSWEASDGQGHSLNSTSDVAIAHVGAEAPTKLDDLSFTEAGGDSGADTASHPRPETDSPDSRTSESSSDSTATRSTTDSESDDSILDEVMSDFEMEDVE